MSMSVLTDDCVLPHHSSCKGRSGPRVACVTLA